MALIHLIYVSSALKELTDAELDAILESAVRHNKPQNITGMLLYARGNFLQVLEGEEFEVDKTFQCIEKDPRHHGIIVLERDRIPSRSFEQWNMGFHRVNEADVLEKPGYAPFFKQGFDATKIGAHPGLALEILLSFSECYDAIQLAAQ